MTDQPAGFVRRIYFPCPDADVGEYRSRHIVQILFEGIEQAESDGPEMQLLRLVGTPNAEILVKSYQDGVITTRRLVLREVSRADRPDGLTEAAK